MKFPFLVKSGKGNFLFQNSVANSVEKKKKKTIHLSKIFYAYTKFNISKIFLEVRKIPVKH